MIAAVTLDGKISQNARADVNWTSRKDKQFFRDQTTAAGVVIFGSTTYQAIGRPMPNRLNIVMTRHPENFANKTAPGILEFTSDEPRAILDKLAKRGYNTVVIGGGGAVYSLFLEQGLIDEIYLNVVSKIFGTGISLFREMDIQNMSLELIEVSRLGVGEVLLKYKTK